MPKYAFTFKKDDIFVEFFTSDKDVVERQFQVWVANADEYAKGVAKKDFKPVKIQPIVEEIEEVTEEVISEPVFENFIPTQEAESVEQQEEFVFETQEEQIQPEAQEELSVQQEQPTEAAIEAKSDDLSFTIEAKEQQPETETESTTETKEESQILEQASSLLKTINTIQNSTEMEEQIEETPVFEQVLEKSIESPTFEPSVGNKDQIFLNLIKSKNTVDKFHYLMITAYYLSEFEKLERFSLKQINSKLMQNLATVIDHATLQEAINHDLVELVPDLTGTSEVAEYRLTNQGEEFFVKI